MGVARLFGAHRRDAGHAVVEHHQERAQLVGQVVDRVHQVRPSRPGIRVVRQVLRRHELARLPVLVVPERAGVADVLALTVDYASQLAPLDHVAPGLEEAGVAGLVAVQVDEAGPLLGHDDAPAVLDRESSRHFGVHVLAGLERLGSHCALLLAADRQGDGVDAWVGEHILVLHVGSHAATVFELSQRPLVQRLKDVADRNYAVSVQPVHQPEPAQAPVPYSEDTYADLVHVRSFALAAGPGFVTLTPSTSTGQAPTLSRQGREGYPGIWPAGRVSLGLKSGTSSGIEPWSMESAARIAGAAVSMAL